MISDILDSVEDRQLIVRLESNFKVMDNINDTTEELSNSCRNLN
jgi:hypothetical protein